MPHAREQDSDALHVEGQGCGLGSQTALSAKSIVGRKMRLRAGTSALFPRRPLELSPLRPPPPRRAVPSARPRGTARRPEMPRRAKQLDADVELPPSRSHSKDGQRQRPAAANKPPNRRSGGQAGQRTGGQHAPSEPRREASPSNSDGTDDDALPRQRANTHDRRGGRSGQRTGRHASAMRWQEGASSDEADEEAPNRRSGHRRGQRTAQRASSAPRQEASPSEASPSDEESPRRNVGLLGVSSDGLWQSTGERAPSAPRQGAASSSGSSEEMDALDALDEEAQSHRARRKSAGTVWTDLGISLGLGEAQPARGEGKTKPPRRTWTTPGSFSRSPAFEKLAPASEVTSEAQARRSTIADGGRCMRRWLQAWLAASAATQARCVAVLVLAAYALVRSQMPLPESLRGLIVYSWS